MKKSERFRGAWPWPFGGFSARRSARRPTSGRRYAAGGCGGRRTLFPERPRPRPADSRGGLGAPVVGALIGFPRCA